jgi:hypothetical protein
MPRHHTHSQPTKGASKDTQQNQNQAVFHQSCIRQSFTPSRHVRVAGEGMYAFYLKPVGLETGKAGGRALTISRVLRYL